MKPEIVNWFFLEDLFSGETRDVFASDEQHARNKLGDSWTDKERVVCHGPCPVNIAA
jgi:hypothetical protein